MKSAFALLTVFISVFFISCQKEISQEQTSSSASGNLLGNYKFISMEVKGLTVQEASQGGLTQKVVSQPHYFTRDNTGTLKFDVATVTSSNMSYTVDTTIKSYVYMNGTLQDSIEVPMQFILPSTNGTAPYKLIGSDSVYFSSGSLFIDGATGSTPTTANGARLRFDGNMLYMTSQFNDVRTIDVQGAQVNSSNQVTQVVTLQKL